MNVPKVFGLKGLGIALLIGCTVGSGCTWRVRDMLAAEGRLKASHAQTKAVQKARTTDHATVQVSADVGAKVESKTQAVRAATRTNIERIPAYVSPAADAACRIPSGFVRAHDAAASGVPGPAPGPGQSDEAPSGVDLSAVARTVTLNYGACHETAEQVVGWQEFYRELQAKMAVK